MIKALKYDPYLQTEDFIAWLEAYAREGWFIKGLNQDNLLVSFKKAEPQRVHYCVFSIENSKLFNRTEFLEIAKAQGWDVVGSQTYLRELYLFISHDENPIPLETDPIEQEHKNRKLKRYALWSVGLSIVIILIYLVPRKNGTYLQWSFVLAYSYLGLMHIVQALRTAYSSNPSELKRKRIANTVKMIRIMMVSGFMVVLIGAMGIFLHSSQVEVKENPLIELNVPSQAELVNAAYTQSRFSFLPNATAMGTIVEEGELTKSIYQSKQNYLMLSDLDFREIVDKELDWFRYDPILKYEVIEGNSLERVLLRSNNGVEYLSYIKRGNTIFSLHTINLTLEEHKSMLMKMEEEA